MIYYGHIAPILGIYIYIVSKLLSSAFNNIQISFICAQCLHAYLRWYRNVLYEFSYKCIVDIETGSTELIALRVRNRNTQAAVILYA